MIYYITSPHIHISINIRTRIGARSGVIRSSIRHEWDNFLREFLVLDKLLAWFHHNRIRSSIDILSLLVLSGGLEGNTRPMLA